MSAKNHDWARTQILQSQMIHEITAVSADSLTTSSWWETLSRNIQLSDTQIPNPEKLWDNVYLFYTANCEMSCYTAIYISTHKSTWLTLLLHLGLSTIIASKEALPFSNASSLPGSTRCAFIVHLPKIKSRGHQNRVFGLLVNPVLNTEPVPNAVGSQWRFVEKSNDYL